MPVDVQRDCCVREGGKIELAEPVCVRRASGRRGVSSMRQAEASGRGGVSSMRKAEAKWRSNPSCGHCCMLHPYKVTPGSSRQAVALLT